MKPVSVLLHEISVEEAATLPKGFPILEYDSLYESLVIKHAGDKLKRDKKRYVYLLYRDPPVNATGGTA